MKKYHTMKFNPKNEKESKIIQEILFELGYGWNMGDDSRKKKIQHIEAEYLYTDNIGFVMFGVEKALFISDNSIYMRLKKQREKYYITECNYTIYGEIVNQKILDKKS